MSATSIILPTTPSRSRMTSSLQSLSSSSNFEDVKTSCAKFSAKFDAWVAQARKSRALRESEFKQALASTTQKQAELKAEIEECTRQVMALNEAREKEAVDIQNAKDTVAQLTGEQESKEVEHEELMRKVTDLKRTLKEKCQAFAHYKGAKAAQLEKNGPELACFEDRLALVIKNLDANVVQFVFTHIDEKNWSREYSFVIDVSVPKVYKLVSCKPEIPNVDSLVEWLNNSRDFYTFLKLMRKGYLEFTKSDISA